MVTPFMMRYEPTKKGPLMLHLALKSPPADWPKVGDKVAIKSDPAGQASAVCEHSNGTIAEVCQLTDTLGGGDVAEIGDRGTVISILAVTTAEGGIIGIVEVEPEV